MLTFKKMKYCILNYKEVKIFIFFCIITIKWEKMLIMWKSKNIIS